MEPIGSLSVGEFLRQLGDKAPAPGGGASACAAGAIAAAQARMVVEYSVGKKNLAEHQPALERARETLRRLAAIFLELADEDAAAYGLVNELSRLPETDPRRMAEYAGAVEASLAAPRAALAGACDLLRLLAMLAPITNRHLRSDLAIAAVLGEGAARSAWWNVAINLPTIADEKRRAAIGAESAREVEAARDLRRQVEREIERSL
ncbi:MAG: cyclodeaminase/cyclohydrolase family protein [Phycisphaerales bacterium]|nr:cyclodeaminase/cyclohydrolase family protein [Phycisphaerales bacterium]